MAIGDTLNQNPFGTNFNPEDEEEKKARLAAQGAMMGAGSPTVVGAGNIPASAFGQAPAVAPFSMEAAGQVNPMMEQQSLAVPPQAPVTFLPYADDVAPPPASALSVFTPGGEVKPNVDVNAITPSPEMTSPSSVNTALNQEVAVGSPSQEPGYFQRVGEFAKSALNRDQGLFDVDRLSTAADDLLGSAMRNLTPAEDRRFANNEPFGKTFTDTFAITRPDGTKFYPDEVTSSAGSTQAPSEASALGATPSVTPPVETPSEGAQGQTAALDPTSDEAILANRAEREAQFAPTNGLTTVGGASLSEFLSGQAMPEQGFTQEESPLGGRGVTLTPDQMNELSAEREARIGADQTISDRDRRAARGDGISMADQTDMAKANARGASPREVARGNQVANALGVDLKTGQPLQATGGLSETERLNREKFLYQQGQDILAGKVLDQEATTARTEAFETSRNNVRSTQDSYEKLKPVAEEIANLSGSKFTEGMLGWTANKLPFSTDAAQIERLTTEFEGSAFLQGLIDAKSKGATFGALSEREGDRILGQWGKITSPKSTNKERISAINSMLGSIQRAAERAQSDHRERFPELFNQTNASAVQGTGQRYNNDQDHGAAVETHFVG